MSEAISDIDSPRNSTYYASRLDERTWGEIGRRTACIPSPVSTTIRIGAAFQMPSGGRFAGGSQTKTFVLYRYNGIPPVSEFVECHPVTEWKR